MQIKGLMLGSNNVVYVARNVNFLLKTKICGKSKFLNNMSYKIWIELETID